MAPELHWLDPRDPPNRFPDSRRALRDPDGLLAVGGDLSVERLLAAYRRGIFPWYSDDQPILWWSPDPRAVLFPGELRVSRSLRRTLRKNRFAVSVDRDFDSVISACAQDRDEPGTWITADMLEAYRELHRYGAAHSVETWQDEKLAGGLYGVNIGGVFFGESMFSRHSDASKVALVRLVALCRKVGIRLIDCQLASAHLATLGARQISREQFEALLQKHVELPSPSAWSRPPQSTDAWIAEPG